MYNDVVTTVGKGYFLVPLDLLAAVQDCYMLNTEINLNYINCNQAKFRFKTFVFMTLECG